ncbi:protein toll-like [Anastrepha obliqua]|uniref:protein toll-like n=1 Tax=Anastrepha obliqua TaxID=95512 RepID=UPI00240A01AD|nr:protein toll-like [Anastrepha obliqua]
MEDCKALNTNSFCQCSLISRLSKRFILECVAPKSRGKFEIYIKPGKYVRIECNNTKANEYESLPSMKIGDSRIVHIKHCPLPESKPIVELLTHFGIPKVVYLTYATDEHSANITKYHLSGLGYLQNLKLNSKPLKNSADYLVRNPSNLIWLELRAKNRTLSERFLEPLPNLEYLDLGNNFLEHLPNGVFKNQHKLEHLNLRKNNLRQLNKEVFRGVNTLTVLDLKSNEIESLEHDVFSLLSNMTSLNLNRNRIHELPVGLFAANEQLTVFKLKNNKVQLKSLPTGLFANLPILEAVHISCGLETLHMDLFKNSTKITSLNMNKNLLTTLPKNLLNDQQKLLSLDLSLNRLQSLPDTLFQNTKHLRVLKLSHNQLVEISSELFSPLSNLEHLYLNNNNLININFNAFRDTTNLKSLQLENNQIGLANASGLIDYTSSPFRYLFKLEKLNLRNNSIKYLHKDWRAQLLALRKLDLSYNKIHAFADHDLRFISRNGLEVNLTHNLIEQIDFKTIKNFILFNDAKAILIDLNSNPIYCDCVLFRFLKFMFGDSKKLTKIKIIANNLKCVGPSTLKGKGVMDLSLTELFCPLDEEFTQMKLCPNNCECLVRPFDLILFMNCSHSNMSHLPKLPHLPILKGIVLNVAHNKLTKLPLNTTTGYADVLALQAPGNQLQSIEVGNLPNKLQYLDVRHNQLQRLNASLVDFLNSSTRLQTVYLAHNPWICDCEAKPLVEFAKNVAERPKFAEQDMGHMRCIVKSSEISLRFMKNVSDNQMCPIESNCLVHFVVILIVIQILDEPFITKQLVAELEHGPIKYKLCLPKRDWIIGESFTKQIKRSVGESQRTMVVLSKNFLKMWSDKKVRKAHISVLSLMCKHLIVIIYNDIDRIESLDEDVQMWLAKSTYIKWGHPLFWPYLRASLREETYKDVMERSMPGLMMMVY